MQTLPETLGPENRGHYTAGHYRDFLSFEPLPSRIGENFPNTEKQEQTSTKWEDREICPKEQTRPKPQIQAK